MQEKHVFSAYGSFSFVAGWLTVKTHLIYTVAESGMREQAVGST